jgi:uncharacterized membrane protein SpoIIM required for sporulation
VGWFALSLAIALTLLTATWVTVLIAVPMLIVAATIEVYVWPHILESLSSYHYSLHTWIME